MSEILSDAGAAPVAAATSASVQVPDAQLPGGAGSVIGMLGSLAVVVGLIFALAWLARRLQGLRAARGGLLQVTGGIAVGNKERVVIVRIGNDHFLVGVAQGQVTLLHRFASAPGVPQIDGESGDEASVVVPFADRLRELLGSRKAA